MEAANIGNCIEAKLMKMKRKDVKNIKVSMKPSHWVIDLFID